VPRALGVGREVVSTRNRFHSRRRLCRRTEPGSREYVGRSREKEWNDEKSGSDTEAPAAGAHHARHAAAVSRQAGVARSRPANEGHQRRGGCAQLGQLAPHFAQILVLADQAARAGPGISAPRRSRWPAARPAVGSTTSGRVYRRRNMTTLSGDWWGVATCCGCRAAACAEGTSCYGRRSSGWRAAAMRSGAHAPLRLLGCHRVGRDDRLLALLRRSHGRPEVLVLVAFGSPGLTAWLLWSSKIEPAAAPPRGPLVLWVSRHLLRLLPRVHARRRERSSWGPRSDLSLPGLTSDNGISIFFAERYSTMVTRTIPSLRRMALRERRRCSVGTCFAVPCSSDEGSSIRGDPAVRPEAALDIGIGRCLMDASRGSRVTKACDDQG